MSAFSLICLLITTSTSAVFSQLNNRNLRVVTVIEPPFVIKNNSEIYSGFMIDLLDKLASRLDFRYTVYDVAKYDATADASFTQSTGLIEDVVTRRADVGIGALTVTRSREAKIDFSTPFMITDLVMVFHKPQPGSPFTFKTVEEMFSRGYRFGALAHGTTYQRFQKSRFPVFRHLGAYMRDNFAHLPQTSEDGFRNVSESSDFVFISEEAIASYAVGQRCNLMISGYVGGSRIEYGIAFPSKSPLKRIIDRELLSLQESGLLEELKSRWWAGRCQKLPICVCELSVSSEEESGEFYDGGSEILGPFTFYWIISLFALLVWQQTLIN